MYLSWKVDLISVVQEQNNATSSKNNVRLLRCKRIELQNHVHHIILEDIIYPPRV